MEISLLFRLLWCSRIASPKAGAASPGWSLIVSPKAGAAKAAVSPKAGASPGPGSPKAGAWEEDGPGPNVAIPPPNPDSWSGPPKAGASGSAPKAGGDAGTSQPKAGASAPKAGASPPKAGGSPPNAGGSPPKAGGASPLTAAARPPKAPASLGLLPEVRAEKAVVSWGGGVPWASSVPNLVSPNEGTRRSGVDGPEDGLLLGAEVDVERASSPATVPESCRARSQTPMFSSFRSMCRTLQAS
mmetsp:Transcript_9755/g.24958  ORF Transcript_9755/g.24958 Transcript_9755/m.24958 type:complete len:243 (-) Transcript_9755:451-1179(-)